MSVRFTNSLGGKKEDFEPLHPPRVGVYVCGPTVYDVPHMGNARPAVVFDVLRRHLSWRGYDVLFVRNITDVDDKIIARANEDGVSWALLADRYTRIYEDAVSGLGCLAPDISPRASGHIPQMIEAIAGLVEAGFAYPGEGSVYFSVEKLEGYGKLSGRGLDELANRERVEPAPGKHHPLDFALWKAAKPGEPSWKSPWGPGRPGWHIECSVMSAEYLGQPFDIHGGGDDLTFPHHENEMAQAEAIAGVEFVRYWLHNGRLDIRGEKMSKSLKNFVDIPSALQAYPVHELRLFFCGAHYRSQMDYTPEALAEARAVAGRFRAFLRAAPVAEVPAEKVTERLEVFGQAMDDDLNTPEALAALHELVSQGNVSLESGRTEEAAESRAALVEALGVLGVDLSQDDQARELVGPLVELLLAQREEARKRKDFEAADEIRARLVELGVTVEDSAQGPRWFVA